MPITIPDYYAIDDLLSEEERMVRDTVRAFVDEEVLPIIAKHYRRGTFPNELVPASASSGCSARRSGGYGCAGLNAVGYGLICQELERGDSGIRSFVSVQGSLVMYPIYAFGSRSRSSSGCPRWRAAMRSAASA